MMLRPFPQPCSLELDEVLITLRPRARRVDGADRAAGGADGQQEGFSDELAPGPGGFPETLDDIAAGAGCKCTQVTAWELPFFPFRHLQKPVPSGAAASLFYVTTQHVQPPLLLNCIALLCYNAAHAIFSAFELPNRSSRPLNPALYILLGAGRVADGVRLIAGGLEALLQGLRLSARGVAVRVELPLPADAYAG